MRFIGATEPWKPDATDPVITGVRGSYVSIFQLISSTAAIADVATTITASVVFMRMIIAYRQIKSKHHRQSNSPSNTIHIPSE
jgi:hypothetical protein